MSASQLIQDPSVQVDAGLPESRVLIIGTGGTICMQEGPDGLQPSNGFLESAMAPRPSFNDQTSPSGIHIMVGSLCSIHKF